MNSRWYLIVREPGMEEARFEIAEGATLGRHGDCQCRLTDGSISARHARIDVVGDACVIMDLGSKNSTRIRQGGARQKLTTGKSTTLEPGMVLQLGKVVVEVHKEEPLPLTMSLGQMTPSEGEPAAGGPREGGDHDVRTRPPLANLTTIVDTEPRQEPRGLLERAGRRVRSSLATRKHRVALLFGMVAALLTFVLLNAPVRRLVVDWIRGWMGRG